jgi:predicted RNase H-like HicB family nuclease
VKFLVTLDRDEKGWVVAECPALPGCVSQGRTVEEAVSNVREAILVSLETRRAEGLPLALDIVEVEVQAPTK